MSVVLERWQTGVLAGSVLVAGLAVGGGAFLGGFALGDTPAPPPPTELAEKTYTDKDLEAALVACELDGATLESSSVTLIGSEWPALNRQCFVAEMGASEIADRDYTGTLGTGRTEGGEYSWSNVHMSWEQTDEGRDVSITVQ